MSILVIADDLTGAAEIAGIAAHHGLSSCLLRGGRVGSPAQREMTVIDLDSRQCDANEAAARVRHALDQPGHEAALWVYKKVDSLLRGNVATEVTAAIKAIGRDRALLVPQNPSRGRTIRHGRYEIDGVPLDQTDLGRTREHPIRTAEVAGLLGSTPVTIIPRRAAANTWPQAGVLVPDAHSHEDLHHLAGCLDDRTLPCGGGEFFEACLMHLGHPLRTAHHFTPPLTDGYPLWVCGTASRTARKAIALLRSAGVRVCAMPQAIFQGTHPPKAYEAWAKDVTDALRRGPAALVIDRELDEFLSDAGRLTTQLAGIVARVCADVPVNTFWIEGGATAEAVCERLGWDAFDYQGAMAPGVVCLSPSAQQHVRVILKPGSYEWPKHFFDTMTNPRSEEHDVAHD